MSLISMNSKSLSQQTGHEVPEIYVVIAKHEVLQIESQMIAESIGATLEEVQEVQADRIYQDILLLLRAEHARGQVDTDLGYDELERLAVEKLVKRVAVESDGEFLLKVATVANRAVRRKAPTNGHVLDPTQHGVRVPLTLTRREVQRFSNEGGREIERTEQLSIHGGAMQNPSFNEVDGLLNVTSKPMLPRNISVRTQTLDPTVEDLMPDMESRL